MKHQRRLEEDEMVERAKPEQRAVPAAPVLAAAGHPRRSVAVDERSVDLAELWQAAAETTDDAIFGLDDAGRVSGWSGAATRLFGYTESEVDGRLASFLFAEPASGQYPGLSAMFHGQVVGRADTEIRRRNGAMVPVTVTTSSLPSGGSCVIVRNRSDLVEVESKRSDAVASLKRQNDLWTLLQRITTIANEAADLTDALHRCMLEICDSFGWQFGHTVLLGTDSRIDGHIWYLADRPRYAQLREVVEHHGRGIGILERACESKEAVWVGDVSSLPSSEALSVAMDEDLRSAFAFPIVFDHQVVAVVEVLGTHRSARDRQLLACARHGAVQIGRVVERERSRIQLSHQAMHDSLTDLPNRHLFMDRLAQAVRGLRPSGPHLAVLFVDLDDFKLINDSLGHNIGDHVLKTVANRLLKVVRPEDTAARFGGDEFIVLCERLPNDEAVGEVANRILDALSEPMVLDGHTGTVVTGCVGIAIATSPDARPEHLIRDADAAMYRAKEQGRGQFNIFDSALHERAHLKLSIGNELRPAIANQEIRLVYQPQFRISDGALIGVEALARWDHPVRGVLSPLDWIPIAEENQMIVPIGEWIIGEACRAASRWRELSEQAGLANPFKMCVNVSAVQLARPELIDAVVSSLRTTGVDPGSLCIEVTESVLMGAPGMYLEALLGLKLLGLSIAVDDFGTGYSSLAYLRRFPIDMIKVDKGFVDGLGHSDERGLAILRAVIQLSEALGVTSVAEGVETAEQAQVLGDSGCFAAQGYFYGRPQSAESITGLLLATR